MRARVLIVLWLIGLLMESGCRPQVDQAAESGKSTLEAKSLIVFAAASLTEAFTQIGEKFEAQHPGLKISFNFGGSAQLAQQLAQEAPADVFASADFEKMEIVAAAGRVSGDMQQVFVRNRLVVITPHDNPANIQSLPDLAKPGLRLVLAAGEVPVGKYSLDFLGKAAQDPDFGSNFKEAVLENVVSYEENVKAVFSKVALGEADAGIVYSSDISKAHREKVGRLDIPAEWNVVAEYAIAPLRASQDRDLAQAFVDYVISAEGQEILKEFGFFTLDE